MKADKQINRFHVFTKTLWHCFLGCLEFVGIPIFLAYLTTFIAPIDNNDPLYFWQCMERFAFCFTVFEVVVIGIRKMIVDTRVDALNALKTAYEMANLYCETNEKILFDILNDNIRRILDLGVLNQMDIINEYSCLKEYLSNKNGAFIKYKIISLQHAIETQGLLWNYTLILRLFK